MTTTVLEPLRRGRHFRARIDGVFRSAVLRRLSAIRGGAVLLEDDKGLTRLGDGAIVARVEVRDARFYRRLVAGGTVGAGESYIDGDWTCDHLPALIGLLVRNRQLTDRLERGLARLSSHSARMMHTLLRANTESGSKENTAAHYDLGNGLFERFLDDRMQYSAAMFEGDMTLDEASTHKLDRLIDKLELGADDHLLEIGTGWGGLAVYAAQRVGCRVTTTTISAQQFEYARERVRAAGLSERVEVLCSDYRRLEGRYSRIVSVEMVEAVGAEYLDTYFEKVGNLLTEDGLAALQAITIEDTRYVRALRDVDFIKQHVFPGSFIPCVSVLIESAARAGSLVAVNLEDLGHDYALTLAAWRERFEANWQEISELGLDERFRRLWQFYLAYCEGGFRERALSDVQLLLAKPGYRGQPWRARQ